MPNHAPSQWLIALVFAFTTPHLLCNSACVHAEESDVGEAGATEAKPAIVAAILNVDDINAVALVENRLLETPPENVDWVERNEIKLVLKEQNINSLFDAADVAKRIAVGKLLRADVLIVLRSKDDAQPSYELVICETRHGLRLATESIPASDSPERDAGKMLRIIRQGFRKQHQGFDRIVAVLPFISRDLTYRYHNLQKGLPKLIEKRLLARPRLLVVEFSEALAIANEVELVSQKNIERPLPFYLRGQYESDRDGRLTFELTLQHGENRLASRTLSRIAPANAPSEVSSAAQEMINGRNGAFPANKDTRLEAAELARQGRQYKHIGEWHEALAVLEASLLLQPDQEELRRDVIYMLGKLCLELYDPYHGLAEYSRKAHRGLDYHERGIAHMERFLPKANVKGAAMANFISSFWASSSWFESYSKEVTSVMERVQKIQTERRRLVERALKIRARAGTLDDGTFSRLVHYFNRELEHKHVSLKQSLDARLELLRHLQHCSGAEKWVHALSEKDLFVNRRQEIGNGDVYARFLTEISNLNSPPVRVAGKRLLAAHEGDLASEHDRRSFPKRRIPTATVKMAEGPPTIRFRAIVLSEREGKPPARQRFSKRTWIPGPEGIDIVWDYNHIWLMKQKGKLESLFADSRHRLGEVHYDGKSLWLLSPSNPEQPLVALSLDGASRVVFSAKDGLPPMNYGATCAVIAPGKLFVAGGISRPSPARGLGRGWCATVAFDQAGGKQVNVFLEARIHIDQHQEPRSVRKSVELAFRPYFAFPLYSSEQASDHSGPNGIFLRRGTGGWNSSLHPMKVDFAGDRAKPIVLDYTVPSHLIRRDYTPHGGSIYYAARGSALERSAGLFKIDGKGARTVIVDGFPSLGGKVAIANGSLHVVGSKWWTVDEASGEWTLQIASIPGRPNYREFCRSYYYGLILMAQVNGSTFDHYEVEFVAEPVAK